ncbi:MAG: UDP-3-O-(3-hydroxymyristoyl)glucosamine N-acyltransferase [Acidobacteriota bacterium]
MTSPRTTVAAVAELLGGEVRGDGELELTGVGSLEDAGPTELSFLARSDYRDQALASRAGCILTSPADDLGERTAIALDDPYRAFAKAIEHFHPEHRPPAGVSPRAEVADDAELGDEVHVGAFAVVGAGARVGARTVLHPGVVVGPGCTIGDDCTLHPGVVLYPGAELGDRVLAHAGVVIGSDGFGHALGGDGPLKIPHVGRVVVEDDVELGASTCIDRAVLGQTRIGARSKLDNLVQVAHNVQLGPRSILVSQSGVAGSTKLGEGCIVAGQSGVAGHLTLGDGVRVGAKSAVFEDVPDGQTVTGIPAISHAAWKKTAVLLRRLPDMIRRLRALERPRRGAAERTDDDD